jgi:DNA-binding CsgD family transcriptional regulator
MSGNVAQKSGDLAGAARHYENALELLREADDPAGVAGLLNNLGLVAAEQRDLARSRALLEEALRIYRRIGNERGMAIALCNLGHRIARIDGPAAAISCYREALPLFHAIGDKAGVAWGLQALAETASEGAPATAARLYGGAEAVRETIGWSFSTRERVAYEQAVGMLLARMPPAAFEEEWAAGRATPIEQLLAEVDAVSIDPPPEPANGSRRGCLPSGLSAREAEILRLVAAGLTNGQIASALHLSPHTIDTHLRRIYRKVGARSRSAATRVAIEQGLA